MKKKKILRALKKEAKKIPEEKYQVFNRLHRPKFQDAEGTLWASPAEEGEPTRRLVFGVVEEYSVNHGRRIKKLYNKYGWPAVHAYFYVKAGMVDSKLV